MAHKICALRPRLWWEAVTMAARAESVLGLLRSRRSRIARSMIPAIVGGRSSGVPSQTKGMVCPSEIRVSAGSQKSVC
jgi:hypothetical protein